MFNIAVIHRPTDLASEGQIYAECSNLQKTLKPSSDINDLKNPKVSLKNSLGYRDQHRSWFLCVSAALHSWVCLSLWLCDNFLQTNSSALVSWLVSNQLRVEVYFHWACSEWKLWLKTAERRLIHATSKLSPHQCVRVRVLSLIFRSLRHRLYISPSIINKRF